MHWPESAVQKITSSVIESWLDIREDEIDAMRFGASK